MSAKPRPLTDEEKAIINAQDFAIATGVDGVRLMRLPKRDITGYFGFVLSLNGQFIVVDMPLNRSRVYVNCQSWSWDSAVRLARGGLTFMQ